jgi:hypothetical protein
MGTTCRPFRIRTICALALVSAFVSPAAAQDDPQRGHYVSQENADADREGWTAAIDANVFFGRNVQRRLFQDAAAWESQNWLMLGAERQAGAGRLSLDAMLSFERFTMDPQGSPQLFQTGESYRGFPLVHFQHPHDLLMELGATYKLGNGGIKYFFGADLVGSPTLGPVPFMHRASARNNPQVPLIHHYVDSTHITPGVVRAGVTLGPFTAEGSGFRGREPDENRLNIERPEIDSWATRVWWRRGPWAAQFSAGHLQQPEWYDPYDTTRLTASVSYEGALGPRPLAVTLAWGQNRHLSGLNGVSDGFLLEWDLQATRASTIYGRTEVAAKELFGLWVHRPGDVHPHYYLEFTTLTAGYVRDVRNDRFGRVGVGADITLYRMAPGLQPFYESSRSFHVFVRWRPSVAAHVH